MTEVPLPPIVFSSTGAMSSLVDKLIKLKKKRPMVGELLQDLERLLKDHVNGFAGGSTDEQVTMWLKHVRELVYDMEDWVDLLFQRKKDSQINPKLAINLEDSNTEKEQIEEFKAQIQDARDHYRWYDLVNKAPTHDTTNHVLGGDVAVESSLLWEEKTFLAGLDGPKTDVERHLKDEQKKLKVVSILGIEGLGKSTLAREIYEKLKWQFECRAYVSVGRNTSTRTLLVDILHKVTRNMDPSAFSANGYSREEQRLISSYGDDERQLIADLWEFLRRKSYLIFIDDIQSVRTWRVINSAVPDNNLGSRILTATCIKEVAMSCSRRPSDVVYQMKALDKDDSTGLLFITISVEEEERVVRLNEGYDKILKACGGIPLAILVTAGLFGRKSTKFEPLKMIERSILSNFGQFYFAPQGMRKILEISFGDLPLPMKSCFLYLSAFPKNYIIKKGHLIRRWAAEGFITKTDDKCLWETGDVYFKELISRRLIQPVFDYNDDQASGCTVHGMIHDFITSLSAKENFVTMGTELSSGSYPCDTVRRFSLDCSNQDEAETMESSTMHLSRLRTLTVFGGVDGVPNFLLFKFLRVLDLQDIVSLGYHQLVSIGCLSLLRYLGLGGTDHNIDLPNKIMELDNLRTLDSKRTSVDLKAFSTKKLVSLLADDVVIRKGMRKLKELEELSTIRIDCRDSLYVLAGIVNKWKKLRILGVKFYDTLDVYSGTNRCGVIRFLKEVGNSSIHTLTLDDYPVYFLDVLIDCWIHTRPHRLQKFELRLYNPGLVDVPQEMSSLIVLTHLHITVEEIKARDLAILGKLPNLFLLYLYSNCSNSKRCIISKMDGFQSLKVFQLTCLGEGEMNLQFEQGSMRQLRRLWLHFDAKLTKYRFGDFNFGIQHLSCLVQVHATIIRCEARGSDVVTAEAAIREQISQIPSNPLLEFSRLGQHDMINDKGKQGLQLRAENEDLVIKDKGKHGFQFSAKDEDTKTTEDDLSQLFNFISIRLHTGQVFRGIEFGYALSR